MDWKSIIAELQAAGMSQSEIGAQVAEIVCPGSKSRSQAWVSAVLNGSYGDLKWSDGQALIALHAEKVGAKPTAKAA